MKTHASRALLCAFLLVAGVVTAQQRILWHDGMLDAASGRAVIELKIPRAGFVEIEAVSLDFQPRIEIERPNGGILRGDSDHRTTRIALYAAEPATYRVVLSSEAGITAGDGRYLLAVEHAGPRADLTDDSIVRGVLQSDASRYARHSFVDWYTYRIPSTGRAMLSLGSSEFDTVLVAFHADGRERYNDDFGEGTDSALRLSGDPGEMILVGATSFSADTVGRYELSAASIHPPEGLAVYTPGMQLELDRSYHLELVGDAHRFEVFLDRNRMVLISMSSDELIGMIEVETPRGDWLYDAGVGYETGAIMHLVAAEEGIYEIVVRSHDYYDQGEGVYALTVVSGGRRVMSDSGVLDVDPVWLPVPAEANGTLVIDVLSDAFDTVIDLHGPDGELLRSDDDGGEGTNSRIVVSIPRGGEYMLKVYGYSTDDRGPFTVEVSRYDDQF
jgi:hypothetical protein